MAETTTLGVAVEFLQRLGFFDVVLPFLLVFTIVFGVLEKTRLFGTVGEDKLPRKDLNSMAAFVVALFVVGATKIVQSIQVSLPQVAFVLIILVSFMLGIGMMLSQGKDIFGDDGLSKKWITFFGVLIFISILGIFLNSLGYLTWLIGFLIKIFSKEVILGSFIILLMAAVVTYIVGKGGSGGDK